MAETGPSRLLLTIVVVIGLIAGGVGIWGANYVLHPKAQSGILTVQLGDNATVNYIGSFGSGPEIGRTFDTSIFSVYENNATYPKSLYFPLSHSGNPANYTPLPTHIGPSGQYTIGNLSFGTVVTGFWQGLLGMAGNQTRFIVIPPNLGYGPLNPACTETRPLAYSVPVYVSVPASQFSTLYPGISPTSGTTFTDPTYGWTDLVLSVNSTSVVVNHLPNLGQTTRFGSWNITVTNISTTLDLGAQPADPRQLRAGAGDVRDRPDLQRPVLGPLPHLGRQPRRGHVHDQLEHRSDGPDPDLPRHGRQHLPGIGASPEPWPLGGPTRQNGPNRRA
jgi:hypothetical protein